MGYRLDKVTDYRSIRRWIEQAGWNSNFKFKGHLTEQYSTGHRVVPSCHVWFSHRRGASRRQQGLTPQSQTCRAVTKEPATAAEPRRHFHLIKGIQGPNVKKRLNEDWRTGVEQVLLLRCLAFIDSLMQVGWMSCFADRSDIGGGEVANATKCTYITIAMMLKCWYNFGIVKWILVGFECWKPPPGSNGKFTNPITMFGKSKSSRPAGSTRSRQKSAAGPTWDVP